MKTKILASLLLVLICAAAHAEKQVYQQRVLRPDGKPAVGAKVRVFFVTNAQNGTNAQRRWLMKEDDSPQREVTTQTDVNGQFKVEAQNDQEELHLLIVDAPGCALGFGTLDAPLKLLEDKPVFGKVISQNGQPVSGADVIVSVAGTNTYLPVFLQDPRRVRFPELTAKSQADGSFRLRSATLYGFINSFQLWAVVRNGASTLTGTRGRFPRGMKRNEITLYPNVSIRGQVVDYATAKPVVNARVAYTDDALGRTAILTDADGRFHFDDLSGHFARSLNITHPNYPNAVMQVSTDRDTIDDTQLQNEVVIGLRPMAKVSGKIVDEDGKPLPFNISARTQWTQKSGGWTLLTGDYSEARADNGSFEFAAPVGPNVIKAGGNFSGYFADGDGALAAYRTPLEVPLGGLQDLVIKIRRLPGYLVKIGPKPNRERKSFTIFTRTKEGERYLLSSEWLWFYKTANWGDTMVIRGVDSEGKEIFPWTRISAAPDQWPTVIPLS